MSHLGSRLSALVDGQLSAELADQTLAHVAACRECAAELSAARAARQALAAAFDVPIAPDLTARLLALGGDGAGATTPARPGGARHVDFAGTSVPLPGTRPPAVPVGCLSGDLAGRRRVPGRWLGVAAGAGLAAVLALAGLGDLPDVVPSPSPAQALTVLGDAEVPVQRAVTPPLAATGSGPGASSSGWSTATVQRAALVWETADHTGAARAAGSAATSGAPAPRSLPPGYHVTAVRTDPRGVDGVELDLAGPQGLIVLTLTHGRLSPEAAERGTPVEVGDGAVHLLSTAPWHGVWQHGDVVVDVVAAEPSDALTAVVAAYPPQALDDGVPARIARGWRALAGAWSP